MLRSLSAMFVVLGLLFAVPEVHAQIQAKAYAPENLRGLAYNDQVRVISLEYSEQSRGRRIADDQLRFYIDQVNRSNWGFSRIKQDIATSLGGSGGGWNDGGGNSNGRVIRCESIKARERACNTGFQGRVRVLKKLSKGACTEGQTWRQQPGTIWVRNGCRADFVETNDWNQGGGWGDNSNYSVTCASEDNRRRTCAWDGRYGYPQVIQKISRGECREGYSWGYLGNQIWVDRGCRARFGARR